MVGTYNKVLPFKDDERVIDQFGWSPTSVIKPTKASKKKWKDAYLENTEQRRSDDAEYLSGLKFSEFHAGLCEDIVHYWSMVGGKIVDPFAGRLTRAFVSASLGRSYEGYDVSPTTVKNVNEHLDKHFLRTGISGATVKEGDGCMMQLTYDESADLVMTCPPYHRLEAYESATGQLSDIKGYHHFLERINECGMNIERVLKPGGFCVWICGDWREDGKMRSFHSDVINMFTFNAGLKLHDTVIIENQSPFAALQLGKVASKRYTSKVHEYMLVFRKEGEIVPTSNKIKLHEESSLEDFF
tara:strand:+ start:3204 stop:4100 length:897 start_codon:yes stop_codon:yes gene_type:complete